MYQLSPVFVDIDTSGVTTVNGREFGSFQKAANVFRKERNMQAFMQMWATLHEIKEHENNAVIERPILELGQWEIAGEFEFGTETIIRLRSTEQVKYTVGETTIIEEAGFVTGWFLETAQNLKGIRDRTLYLDTGSYLFGDAMGRVTLQNAHVIGYVRDSNIVNSTVGFSEVIGSRVVSSTVEFSRITSSKILHSKINGSNIVNSLISSCDATQFTAVSSQLTDVKGYFTGFNKCVIHSKEFHLSKIANVSMIGDGEKVKNTVDNSMFKTFRTLMKRAELDSHRKETISELKETLKGTEWKVDPDKSSGGRTVLEVSGESATVAASGVPENDGNDSESKEKSGKKDRSDDEEDLDDEDEDDIDDSEYLRSNDASRTEGPSA